MRKTFLVMLTLLAVASAWAGDFDQPQKDCAPCLFSPGKGQPEFELRFRLSKDGSSLVALEVKASGGQATQVLTLREPADAGLFEGGFEVMTTDLDLDGYADLGIATVALPHGARLVEYWLYHPSTRTFVPLKRVGDNDGEGTNDYMLDADPQTRELHCTESANGEPDTYAEYWYRVDGDRAVFRRCRFLGWQDTILDNRGRHYYERCTICGAVDFIFGGATSLYNHCRIICLGDGYITAASTPSGEAFGLVFADCTIDGANDAVRTYLGRPWRPHGAATFLRTRMSAVVRPAGWNDWGQPDRQGTARFTEYGSFGPGAAAGGRAAWARRLTDAEAAAITLSRVLGGADGWSP